MCIRRIVGGPGDELVGPDQNVARLISIASVPPVVFDNPERHAGCGGGLAETFDRDGVAIERKQGEAGPEFLVDIAAGR